MWTRRVHQDRVEGVFETVRSSKYDTKIANLVSWCDLVGPEFSQKKERHWRDIVEIELLTPALINGLTS
jgi:hypothetical protein